MVRYFFSIKNVQISTKLDTVNVQTSMKLDTVDHAVPEVFDFKIFIII